MFSFKKIKVPADGEKELTAYEHWAVRWIGTNGYYHGDQIDLVEFFLNEPDAKDFANKLKEAFKLTKCVGSYSVHVSKE